MNETERFVTDAPLQRTRTGIKAIVELTAYPKGHTAIAVSSVEGPPKSRTILQADNMTLNGTDELKRVVAALIDRLETEA